MLRMLSPLPFLTSDRFTTTQSQEHAYVAKAEITAQRNMNCLFPHSSRIGEPLLVIGRQGDLTDLPFAIGSHLSCSFTSKSYASRAGPSSGFMTPLGGGEFAGEASPAASSSLGGEGDIM